MPHLQVNDANIHYEDVGRGPETIVFSHGLLWSGHMFHNQVAAFKDRYRCVTFDHRGQGQSEVTSAGYDMDTLYRDAAALIEALDCVPCHFVGLSMGGFIGLRLAIRRPDLLKSLILLESSAEPEPQENIPRYRLLNFVARWIGLRPVAGRVMPIMFGEKFLNDSSRSDLKREWQERLIANDRLGITRATTGVISRQGVTDHLDKISTPTLIVVGDQDVATVPAKSKQMHERIADSEMVVIPGAGHTSTVEEPAAVNDAVLAFLKKQKSED